MIEIIRIISRDIPLFLIIKGKYILRDLVELIYQSRVTLVYSENGWSNDELDLKQLKYFNKWIRRVTVRAYRLLIFNKYDSHAIFAFTEYAKKHNIILLYLRAHSTHRF